MQDTVVRDSRKRARLETLPATHRMDSGHLAVARDELTREHATHFLRAMSAWVHVDFS